MESNVWTDESIAFVVEHYATMKAREIAALLRQRTGRRFTKNMVVGAAYRRGLISGRRRIRSRKIDTLPGTMLIEDDLIGCRHIKGDSLPLRRGMYCCKPTMAGSDYCKAHHARHRIAGSDTVPYVGRAAML